MDDVASLSSVVSALWVTVALLAGGFARSRNRSALGWFVLTLIFGPIAAFFLVVLPAVPASAPLTPNASREG